jgi:hypothetical protein
MVNFINHVLGVNAQNWIQEEPFISTPDLAKEFAVWLQSRPNTAPPVYNNQNSTKPSYQNQTGNRGWQRGRGGYANNRGGGHSGQYTAGGGGTSSSSSGQYGSSGGQYGGNGGQYGSGGGQYGSGGGQYGRGGQQRQPSQPSNPRGGQSARSRIICRRYNAGSCTNHYARCRLPISDDKAWHICNVVTNGITCEGYHPAFQHT